MGSEEDSSSHWGALGEQFGELGDRVRTRALDLDGMGLLGVVQDPPVSAVPLTPRSMVSGGGAGRWDG